MIVMIFLETLRISDGNLAKSSYLQYWSATIRGLFASHALKTKKKTHKIAMTCIF
jgi:hypothetical protein